MDKIVVDSVSYVPGKVMVRQFGGHGVQGNQIPASGQNGPSVLLDDLDPGDELKHFRAQVLSHTFPSEAKFFMWDDGAFSVDPACPDGTYSIFYRGLVDGSEYDASVEEQVVIGGASTLSIAAALDLVGASLAFVSTQGNLAINAALDPITSAIVLEEPGQLSISAALGDLGSSLSFFTNVTTLPDIITADRTWQVPPDARVDLLATVITPGSLSSSTPTWRKDPDAVLDYCIDWTRWLEQVPDDYIVSANLVYATPGITVPGKEVRNGALVPFWLAGGSTIAEAEITFRITTNAGRIDDRTMRPIIGER